MPRTVSVVLAAALLAGVSCAPDGSPEQRAATLSHSIEVVDDDPSIPARCRPRAIAVSLWKLFDAVNASDVNDVGALVADESKFEWFSMSEGNPQKDGTHFTAYHVDDMKSFLAERTEENEHLELLALSVSYEPRDDVANLQLAVRRTADDLEARGFENSIAHGKGVVECDEGGLVVMSLGLDKKVVPESAALLCGPLPDGADAATLVCAA
jgi:hypothetical protein